jgi:hypothetical protein
MPAMWAYLLAVCALLMMFAAASIVDLGLLHPFLLSLSSPVLSASSASSSTTAFSTAFHMQHSREKE